MGGKLFIISAPSGTGKTSLLDLVMRQIERVSFSSCAPLLLDIV